MASRGISLGLILIVATTTIISSLLNSAAASSLPLDSQAQPQQGLPPPPPPPPPAETSLLKASAVIKFIGVKHGLSDSQQARSAFEQKVQLVIGQPLTIDRFDPMTNDGTRGSGLIEWHSLDMNDCNEDKIRQLLAKFRNPDANGWTREFKMEFGPDFDMPERVEFEWRNECAANYQKRTLDAAASTTTTTTTTTSAPEPVTNPPEAPSTTTEAPMTTPEPPVTMSEMPNGTSWNIFGPDTNSSETPTVTLSEITTSEFSMLPFIDFNSTLAPIAAVTTASAEVSSTISETSTPETRATSPETLATTTTATTTTTTTAAAETTTTAATTSTSGVPETILKTFTSTAEIPLTFEDLSTSAPEEPENESESESPIDSASSAATPQAEETPAQSSSGASSSPHYGKYIGLTTGFFVFIAYLLCARAYRRQGMYELHEST